MVGLVKHNFLEQKDVSHLSYKRKGMVYGVSLQFQVTKHRCIRKQSMYLNFLYILNISFTMLIHLQLQLPQIPDQNC